MADAVCARPLLGSLILLLSSSSPQCWAELQLPASIRRSSFRPCFPLPPLSLPPSLLLLSAFAREHQREPGSRVTRHPDMSLKLFSDVKVEDRDNNSDAMNERRGRTIGLNNSLMSLHLINRDYEIRCCISSKVTYLCGDTWHT